jgi:hypothetical protein
MTRISILVGTAIAALLLASGSALASSKGATPTLNGSVGPGFTINLTMGGQRVKALKAGRYRFVVSDKASIHNFALEQQTGGNVEKDLTSVSFVGTKTVTVNLTKGRWKFECIPHESFMFGSFTVK